MFQSSKAPSYMQEPDEWTNATIVLLLYAAFAKDSESAYVDAAATVKKAIRERVLESYHNGQQAGPRKQAPRR